MNEERLAKALSGNEGLLSALAGKQAGAERVTADRTRRVVRTSLGVLQEQKVHRKRNISLALAALILSVVFLGPFLWRLSYELLEGDHFLDYTTQITLGAGAVASALVASMLVAGWLRKRP